jgi:hypothetical protein
MAGAAIFERRTYSLAMLGRGDYPCPRQVVVRVKGLEQQDSPRWTARGLSKNPSCNRLAGSRSESDGAPASGVAALLTSYNSYFTLAFMQAGFIVTAGGLLPQLLAFFEMLHASVWRASSVIMAIPILLFVATTPRAPSRGHQ